MICNLFLFIHTTNIAIFYSYSVSLLSCRPKNRGNTRYNRRWQNARSNQRSLLRFTAKIENRGWDHFRPNTPRRGWQFHQCHRHYHSMETFASYDLLGKCSLLTFPGIIPRRDGFSTIIIVEVGGGGHFWYPTVEIL